MIEICLRLCVFVRSASSRFCFCHNISKNSKKERRRGSDADARRLWLRANLPVIRKKKLMWRANARDANGTFAHAHVRRAAPQAAYFHSRIVMCLLYCGDLIFQSLIIMRYYKWARRLRQSFFFFFDDVTSFIFHSSVFSLSFNVLRRNLHQVCVTENHQIS